MNIEAAPIGIPNGVCPDFEINIPGSLFGPASSVSLISSDAQLIKELVSLLDIQLLRALESRSVAEFKEKRKAAFPRYVRAARALSDTAHNLVSNSEIDRIALHAIEQLGADLERLRGGRLGDRIVDQARFTLWTIRKIRKVVRQIIDSGIPKDQTVDRQRCIECQDFSFWAQFHLDTIVAAMKFKRDITEEIQEEICNGLRAAVNAYSISREALDDRMNVVADTPENLPWDEEDERLLAASMRDINDVARSCNC